MQSGSGIVLALDASSSAVSDKPSEHQLDPNSLAGKVASMSSIQLPQVQTTLAPSLTQDPTQRSAFLKARLIALKLTKKTYRAEEKVKLSLRNTKENSYKITLKDSTQKDATAFIEKNVDGENTDITLSSTQDLKPGKYTLVVSDDKGVVSTQEFLWGVLAINADRDVYLPGEKAQFAIAVLDETGGMVCNAKVELRIKNGELGIDKKLSTDDKSIQVNKSCYSKKFTLEPDYETSYTFSEAGNYELSLTAKTKNGDYTTSETISVVESLPFRFQRSSATRLFPVNQYPVTAKVTADEDMEGTVTEVVPSSFEIFASQDEDVQPFSKVEVVDARQFESRQTEVLGISSQLGLPYIPDEVHPSYPVTLQFGEALEDPLLQQKYEAFGLNGHDGIDFALPTGTPVVPVDDGVVVLSQEGSDYGTTVVVQHAWGKSYYGHLSKLSVKEGDQVVRGKSELGLSGSTGLSTGPHLHFGMKLTDNDPKNGYFGKTDPAPYLGLSHDADVLGATAPLLSTVKVITWNVSLKKGETVNLGYQFKAPEISPEFYTLGPLRLFDSNGRELAKEQRGWQLAVDAVTIDSTVSTAQTEHTGASPTIVFTTDQIGYVFYVDSTGVASYRKTTNGGTTWGTNVTVDSQTDVMSVAVWYDQWTPGDTTGTNIYIATNDGADVWYRALNTATDTFGAAVVNATGANQGGAFTAGANAVSITKATNGVIYMGIVDATDSFVIKCSTTCGTATNWTEAGTNPFAVSDNDYVILLPLAAGDVLAIWWDSSADDILSNEYEDGAGTWGGAWTTVDANADENATYDAAFSATLDKATNTIYLAYVDDAATIGAANDDIKTASYDGSTWTAKSDIITNDPNRGITNVSLSYDMTKNAIYAVYSVIETANYTLTGSNYSVRSTDSMSTWSSEFGQLNTSADGIYGLRTGLMNENRIYATWYRITPDDLFGATIADIAPSTEYIYTGSSGTQISTLDPNTSNNYIGAAFTFIRTSGSANVTSIKLTDTGTLDATTYLSNVDIYYETAATCTYNGNETLFGTDTSFDASQTSTVTGTMSVGTSQVCVYAVLDIASGAIGTIELEIENPNADISVSAGTVPDADRLRLPEPTNVRTPGTSNYATIDSTVSTAFAEHLGPSPTVVFTTDQIGYAFYVDSNGTAVYSKTTNGGTTWGTAVSTDSQTDVQGIAVWYDQWTPGNTTGTYIHIATFDSGNDDISYTRLDTSNDTKSTTVEVTTGQTATLAAGANVVAITEGTNGELYVGINDSSDSFIEHCTTTCTTAVNWVETTTNPFTVGDDPMLLLPLPNGDILTIVDDVSAHDLLSKEYEESSGTWDASWLPINSNIEENTNYDAGIAATLNKTDNTIYLAYIDGVSTIADGTDDIKTASYDGSTWTDKGDVLLNDVRGITQLALSYDSRNDDIYAIYSTITDPLNFRTGAVYAKSSSDGMSTWGSEIGSITQVAEREIYGLRSNFLSDERIYATWYGAAADDVFGNTVVDITSGSETPTLDKLMRHGKWFNSSGVRQPFTF
jgi:hypothetical protein